MRMRQKKRAISGVTVPALALLIGSSLWVAGAQRPGQLPVDLERPRVVSVETDGDPGVAGATEEPAERVASDNDCTFLNDPRPFLEDQKLRNAIRPAEMNRVVRWTATLNGTSNGLTDPNTIQRINFIDDEIFSRMASA